MRNKLFLFVFLFAVLAIVDSHAFERKKYNFNSEWRLQIGDFPEAKQSQFDDSRWKAVTLPHAFNEDEAFKVSIEQLTDTVVWYRKHFRIPASGKKQKVFIEFEGVRQAGDFYLNGQYLGKHENGVMAAGFDLTPILKKVTMYWQYVRTMTGCIAKKVLTPSSSGTTVTSTQTTVVCPRMYSCTLQMKCIRLFLYTVI